MTENLGVCRFCGAKPKTIWRNQIIRFECGSGPNDREPRTMTCWAGFVMKLQERITALEIIAYRKKPRTVKEAAIAGGWHPEIKA